MCLSLVAEGSAGGFDPDWFWVVPVAVVVLGLAWRVLRFALRWIERDWRVGLGVFLLLVAWEGPGALPSLLAVAGVVLLLRAIADHTGSAPQNETKGDEEPSPFLGPNVTTTLDAFAVAEVGPPQQANSERWMYGSEESERLREVLLDERSCVCDECGRLVGEHLLRLWHGISPDERPDLARERANLRLVCVDCLGENDPLR